jgi:RimJ/RimL family protein N-acetyltransferase
MIILETPRLALHTWEDTDIDALCALHARPEIARYLSSSGLPWTRAKTIENLEIWRGWRASHGVGKLKVVRREDGAFLGRSGFGFMEDMGDRGEYELGFTIAPEYQGNGYATEIADAQARWLIGSGKADHFIAFAHSGNRRSLMVMERIGMRYDRDFVRNDMPCSCYVMTSEDLSARPV